MAKGVLDEWGRCSRTVFLNNDPLSLAYWRDTVAVGLSSGGIVILDAITGGQVTVLSGHVGPVASVSFSLDGTLLVSGSEDGTAKLWDIQTGGIVKTFSGHTSWVLAVSISPDCATIASGSRDKTICLWNIQRGDCFCTISGHGGINYIGFSPANPKLLISASGDCTVQHWDINGCQVGPPHDGDGVVFSLDGTHFISWGEQVATVRNSASRVIIAELHVPSNDLWCCCFSPDGKLVAGGAGCIVYVWDIVDSDTPLVETLVGHTNNIVSLAFSSSIISVSIDHTVRFWQIGTSQLDLATADYPSTPPTPSPIQSVSLQARDGVAISSDLCGVVKTWDILTGLCKTSFQTPYKPCGWIDAQLIEGRLIAVWLIDQKIHIWDVEKSELLQIVDAPGLGTRGLRISGDGSKVFCLIERSIQVWSIQTGGAVGQVEVGDDLYLDPLCVGGSRIWVCSKNSSTQGWDFGAASSSPILLSTISLDKSHLNFIDGTREWNTGPSLIKNTVTGEEVFQLVGRYAKPAKVWWNGQYLVAGYRSGEMLILDFNGMPPQ